MDKVKNQCIQVKEELFQDFDDCTQDSRNQDSFQNSIENTGDVELFEPHIYQLHQCNIKSEVFDENEYLMKSDENIDRSEKTLLKKSPITVTKKEDHVSNELQHNLQQEVSNSSLEKSPVALGKPNRTRHRRMEQG
ncbi:uncharacterized protein LOC123675125 isoform X2 [Harmonia axyridis]|uniref:uncharacterized protein LOC123675125 isoform X2 n=1 Tax=Harmonia axyridis TaxID=115357 RepID=UPI001E274F0B|nr:uncharacterized protein LOC123675125 isoform X2 [Harmonia axyridis]